ncbi:hypothetical protein HYU93_02910 [Candidatus Daviesbacteria bacterium]|nr:hypothetical protein [Candidatus Daviesbacteria bacterium]
MSQEELNPNISRRHAIGYSLGLILTAACGRADATRGDSPKVEALPRPDSAVYGGVIEDIRGLPYVEKNHLNRILDALTGANYPLLQKISSGLRIVTTSAKPAELPEEITAHSFPLAVVWQNNRISQVVVRAQVGGSRDEEKYIIADGVSSANRYKINSLDVAIQLGIPEHISLILLGNLVNESWEAASNLNVKITDINGSPLTDPRQQRAAGFGIMLVETTNKATPVYKIIDGYPILMLGAAAMALHSRNQLPEETQKVIYPFLMAAQILNDRGVDFVKDLMGTVNQWTASDRLMLPTGTVRKIFEPQMVKAVLQLQEKLSKI